MKLQKMVQQRPIFSGKATVHKVKCEEMASMIKLCNATETLKGLYTHPSSESTSWCILEKIQ